MKNLSIQTIVFLVGIIQAMFFSFLFLLKKKRILADIIAGLWLISFCLDFSIVVFLGLSTQKNVLLSNFELLFTLLNGPFLFLYIKKLIYTQSTFIGKEYYHFLPFALGIITVFIFNNSDLTPVIPYTGIVSGISYFIYSISFLLKLKSYPNLSTETLKTIKWLLTLCFGLLIVWILPLIFVNVQRITRPVLHPESFYLLVTLFIFYLSFKGINQQIIYIIPSQKDITRMISKSDKSNSGLNNYSNSSLGMEEMKKIHSILVQSMEISMLFLNPNLNLKLLSDELKIPPHYITQTLNVYAQQNYYDFINFYRIKEYKHRISSANYNNYAIFGIAMECGFNSKSTFNRVFKKTTGKTPSEYKAETTI